MGLGILLVPALGGYLFLTAFNLTRDRVANESGYHVVFRAACVGVVLFGAARLLVYVIADYCPSIAAAWAAVVPIEYSGTATASVALGWLAPRLLNLVPRWDRARARREAADEGGDLVGLLIDQALDRNELVEVSLKEGKCYIGYPMKSVFGFRDDGDIAILPVASGYRDQSTRDLKITINYSAVIQKEVKDDPMRDMDDFRVVIPVREIASVRMFSPKAFDRFEAEKGHAVAGSNG